MAFAQANWSTVAASKSGNAPSVYTYSSSADNKVAVAASGYTMMTNEIELAKELPEPPVTAEEFRLQTEIIDNAILDTKEDISEIKKQMDRMESRLFETARRR